MDTTNWPPLSTGVVDGRLTGKIAFVTGTARGQGRAVAALFARAGAIVYGADILGDENQQTAAIVEQAGGIFIGCELDVSDEACVSNWIEQGVANHGRIDVLYNNAGFAHFAPVSHMSYAQWSETLKHELDVVFLPSRSAWPHMMSQRAGSIINVASVSGMIGTPLLPAIAHAAGKGGVIGVTKQFALEGAPYGIRVNSISPGPIITPVTQQVLDADPAFRAEFNGWPSLARPGQPVDVAYAALFLASDEAAWITGVNLPVDGGYSGKGGRRPA